ncbi:TonB-dependent receptor [Granulicella arctica]|uniref:Outer membrane receptor protein involved in Fe transport n=1 Tax=Granulicella arctica TaxID=940613 RepID=A0A7Y9PI43_9BACT|nr:TonB-dependent receptor [Granulicella arctica]NYF80174.1 outer membrane receptor protein involved in Fe transport [Granulicella arctica]
MAQTQLHGHVVDRSGRPVSGAGVDVNGRAGTVFSDAAGTFVLEIKPIAGNGVVLRARDSAMDSGNVSVAVTNLGQDVELVMVPSSLSQQATVTATRSSVEMGPAAVTQSTLSGDELTRFPALTLDESLRQHAGFELFRRSSGWVQNPTSQGVSLRGLGSTAVSRTLILANSAPLNDPFGGWIHWNELPPEAIDAVTITSGGGSDLYGSSALGGVIDVVPAHPETTRADVSMAAASEDTRTASGRGDLQQGRLHELVAGEDFRTAGYILTAPAVRGTVDVPANVHFENGRVELDRTIGAAGRAFVTGNVLNETRGNGTRLTTNGTRLWRYLAGDDWNVGARTSGRARLFGSQEVYRQSFSSVNATRSVETLTRLQRATTQEMGGSTDASYHRAHLAFVGGADVRDIRAGDLERPVTSAHQETSSRQRFIGGFGEAIGEFGRWSGAASVRIDSASNLDTTMFTGAVPKIIPNRNEIVASPRVGVVRQLTQHVSVHGSGFRAFRTPSMNELYRTGQVGSETTLANPKLLSERATGAEGGVSVHAARISAQATYFWTEVNRPVAAVLVSSTATTILEMRQNLGQFQSQGVETSVQVNEDHAISAKFGYQYAHAVVTNFSAQTSLVGNWIPDVPRETATAQVRFRSARLGDLTIAGRNSGRAFDDSANTFVLHSFFQLDAYGERSLGRGFTVFVSAQNMLDRRADVARTPVLTQGIPFVAQGGIRFGWGRSS